MAGRIDQVERIGLAVGGLVVEPNGLRLDGNAALALELHIVEHLFFHLALGQSACRLNQAVSQRGFAMVDMRDDGKIADMFRVRAHGRAT